jgi:hypothetical protein
MKIFDEIKPSGHLEITKVYSDGRQELVLDEKNMIVSGFGVGLSYLFSLSGSQKITDYQLDRFQIGVCSTQTVSSTVYKLDYPLSSASHYGVESKLVVVSATQIQNGTNVTNQVFALIPFKNVTRLSNNSVRYTLILDERAANNLASYGYPGGTDASIREIGLFMKNPRGDAQTASILAAYKQFSPLKKSSDFSLIFRWTIQF